MVLHRHHIIPTHAGGSDDPSNIIELTVERHAEAHRILFEQYGRWQDEIAWKGLAGLMSRAELIQKVQSQAAKDNNTRNGNPWGKKRTSMNWAENPDLQKKATEAATSATANAKRIKSMSENQHQQGSKNSRFGKSLYVDQNGTRKYFDRGAEPEGWILRSITLEMKKDKTKGSYGRSWFNDGSKNYFLTRDDPLVTELKLEKRRITA